MAGLVVLLAMLAFLGGRHRTGKADPKVSDGQLRKMIQDLQTEKEEVSSLLAEARQTTAHLSNMIDCFERTFYSQKEEDESVTKIFTDLRRDMKTQCRRLEGRFL